MWPAPIYGTRGKTLRGGRGGRGGRRGGASASLPGAFLSLSLSLVAAEKKKGRQQNKVDLKKKFD